jgi:hypothetical protein
VAITPVITARFVNASTSFLLSEVEMWLTLPLARELALPELSRELDNLN